MRVCSVLYGLYPECYLVLVFMQVWVLFGPTQDLTGFDNREWIVCTC